MEFAVLFLCILCENALIEFPFISAFNSMPYSSGNNISHIVWLLCILFWLLYYLHYYWFMTRFLKYAYFWSNCVCVYFDLLYSSFFADFRIVLYRVVTFCAKLRREKCFKLNSTDILDSKASFHLSQANAHRTTTVNDEQIYNLWKSVNKYQIWYFNLYARPLIRCKSLFMREYFCEKILRSVCLFV